MPRIKHVKVCRYCGRGGRHATEGGKVFRCTVAGERFYTHAECATAARDLAKERENQAAACSDNS